MIDRTEEILREIKEKERENNIYFLKQKLVGILGIILGIICPLLLEGDITASVIVVPLGLYALFTKEKICTF